jgi:hypothetical protein
LLLWASITFSHQECHNYVLNSIELNSNPIKLILFQLNWLEYKFNQIWICKWHFKIELKFKKRIQNSIENKKFGWKIQLNWIKFLILNWNFKLLVFEYALESLWQNTYNSWVLNVHTKDLCIYWTATNENWKILLISFQLVFQNSFISSMLSQILLQLKDFFANTKVDWQVSLLSPLFSLTYLYHLSNSLHKLLNIIYGQSTFYPFSTFTNVITFLLLIYCTFSLW